MKTLSRTAAAALACACLAAPAAAQRLPQPQRVPPGLVNAEREPPNWPEVTEAFTRALTLGRNGTFDLKNIAGDITIRGDRGNEVRITATKRARHRVDAQARRALQALGIDVLERGGNVEVRTQHPSGRAVWTAVDYAVSVPTGANVVLETVSGDLRLSNIDGELRATTISGDVTASDVRRLRQITTVGGNVEVSDSEADELSASTLHGDLSVRNLKGRVLSVRTVSGDARLVNVEMDRASLQSTAGDLEYSGRLARSGRYEFQTHAGNIRVNPADNRGFDLEARTFSGDVRSDYELNVREDERAGSRRRALSGTFGDAGAVLSAQTFSGDILIVRR